MEHIATPKVENVFLLDNLNPRNSTGTSILLSLFQCISSASVSSEIASVGFVIYVLKPNHERTISLRFLDTILRVLRLEVSLYNFYITN
jgi:hypothetical protein